MRSSFVAFAFLSIFAACGGTVSSSGDDDKLDAGPAPDDHTNPDASPSSDASDSSRIAPGVYGGLGVQVTVASDGSATFEFDCANGATGPITVTSSGSTGPVFSITGTVTQEEGIALPDAAPPAAQPALFTGHVFGNTISFSYSIDGQTPNTQYSATLGEAPNLAFCG